VHLASAQSAVLRDISGDGGGAASSGPDAVVDTIGQPVVGQAASANYSVNTGFWGTFDSPLTPDGLVATVLSNEFLQLPVSTLVAGSDADGNTVMLVGTSQTSAQESPITIRSNVIAYYPPPGFVGNDTFTYTIQDGVGDSAVGTVSISGTESPYAFWISPIQNIGTIQTNHSLRVPFVVHPPEAPSFGPVRLIRPGVIQFSFTGPINATYAVVTSTNLSLPLSLWTVLGPIVPSSGNTYQFTTPTAATDSQRFYAVISPIALTISSNFSAPNLGPVRLLSPGVVQFSFTGNTGSAYSVVTTTNLSLPLTLWTVLGPILPSYGNTYQFTSPATTSDSQRFYAVISTSSLAASSANSAPNLGPARVLAPGVVQFSFLGNTDANYLVVTTTNLNVPTSLWTVVGPILPSYGNTYQFTSPATTSDPHRFYAVIAQPLLTVSSTNLSLVPDSNLAFSGSGTNFNMTIAPAASQSGSSLITVLANGPGYSVGSTFLATFGLFANLSASGPNRVVSVTADPGLNCFVQDTTNLLNPQWTTLGQAVESPAGFYRLVDTGPHDPVRFYRISVH
jgi:hypothetical protein